MNDLAQINIKTMSSLEIAALTKKTHAHVLRDIRNMIEQIGNPKLDYEQYQVVTDSHTQRTSEIKLDKNLTLTLITGYDAGLRYSITKRWDELERSAAQPVMALPDFTNPVEAARAFADQYEAKQIAQEQLAIAQPKVNFYDTVAASSSLMTVSDAAKKISMSAQELNKKLIAIGAYDKRRLPKKVFSHDFITKGYGVMKLTADGYDRNLLTQSGQIYIIGLFSRSAELEAV